MGNNIGFKITVEFECPNMIDDKTLQEEYGGNVMAAYQFISDNFKESVINFSTREKVIGVEILNDKMNIKHFLKTILEPYKSEKTGLFREQLKVLFFEDFEELNGQTIEIIEESNLKKLITVKGFDCLNEKIGLNAIFLLNDDVFVRCTEDSVRIKDGGYFPHFVSKDV